MAYQNETLGEWPLAVYQIGVTDPVLGGPEGPVNLMGLALAKRGLHQRIRNVTLWDADLAATHGYPTKACVVHGAVSWRAVVDNNVAPGTDPAKWERWGYSESELDDKLAGLLPYGAPTVCANTGPDGDANKARLHKSSLGEYWMWLGDGWRVVAGYHFDMRYAGSASRPSGTTTLWTWIPPRPGHVHLTINCNALTAASNDMVAALIAINGVVSVYDVSFAPVTGQPIAVSGGIDIYADLGSVVEFRVQLISTKAVMSHLTVQYNT